MNDCTVATSNSWRRCDQMELQSAVQPRIIRDTRRSARRGASRIQNHCRVFQSCHGICLRVSSDHSFLIHNFTISRNHWNYCLMFRLTLGCMISPLVWSGILLPVLPESMGEFIQAPVPLLVGVLRLPDNVDSLDDLDEDTAVWFPEIDLLWKPRSCKGRMPEFKSL